MQTLILNLIYREVQEQGYVFIKPGRNDILPSIKYRKSVDVLTYYFGKGNS